jgi:beta-lactam-binding protein with PASTA domain
MKSSLLRSIQRVFTIVLGATAVVFVVLLFAFLALRVAIHGREVAVPNLAGLSDADAASAARDLGLNLTVENRFYSPAVAPNHVLSQSPVAGPACVAAGRSGSPSRSARKRSRSPT